MGTITQNSCSIRFLATFLRFFCWKNDERHVINSCVAKCTSSMDDAWLQIVERWDKKLLPSCWQKNDRIRNTPYIRCRYSKGLLYRAVAGGTDNLDWILPGVYYPSILSIEVFEKSFRFKSRQGCKSWPYQPGSGPAEGKGVEETPLFSPPALGTKAVLSAEEIRFVPCIGWIWSEISKVIWAPCELYSLAETPQPPAPAFGLIYEGAIGQPR